MLPRGGHLHGVATTANAATEEEEEGEVAPIMLPRGGHLHGGATTADVGTTAADQYRMSLSS